MAPLFQRCYVIIITQLSLSHALIVCLLKCEILDMKLKRKLTGRLYLSNCCSSPRRSLHNLSRRSVEEEFPHLYAHGCTLRDVCAECTKFIADVISSSRRSLDILNNTPKRKTKVAAAVVAERPRHQSHLHPTAQPESQSPPLPSPSPAAQSSVQPPATEPPYVSRVFFTAALQQDHQKCSDHSLTQCCPPAPHCAHTHTHTDSGVL